MSRPLIHQAGFKYKNGYPSLNQIIVHEIKKNSLLKISKIAKTMMCIAAPNNIAHKSKENVR